MLSVIIPVKDEEESLQTLHRELTRVLQKITNEREIIYVDDGSTDRSHQILLAIQKKDPTVQLITFRANFGKSAALSEGFRQARGDTLVMLDSDLQDDPKEIPKLLKKLNEGYDLVSGWRRVRADNTSKRLSSMLFNWGTAMISGVKLHDFNCGLKVLKKEVGQELYLHGELHRFIPVLAAKSKFKIAEVPVRHFPRRFGKSKFGLERSWRGIIDLLTTIFLTDYASKPAHFFGKIGLVFFTIGFLSDFYVAYLKLTTGSTQGHIPLLLAGILFILLGVQLLSTGLIAEMITHYFRSRQRV